MPYGKTSLLAPAAFALALGLASPLSAQQLTDEQFAQQAAGANLAEIALGEQAMALGSHEAVVGFGQRMVQDHGMNLEQLQAVAGQEGLQLPAEPMPEDVAIMQQLAEQPRGQDYDRAYMQHMVTDHQEAIALFEQGQTVESEALQDYAAQSLPVLQEHLDLAREVLALTAPAQAEVPQ